MSFDGAISSSKRDAQHELHLAWSACTNGRRVDRGLDDPELRWYCDVAGRIAVLRAIEDVKNLTAELDGRVFAQRDVLREADIQLRERRTSTEVPASVAQRSRSGSTKSGRIYPLRDGSPARRNK